MIDGNMDYNQLTTDDLTRRTHDLRDTLDTLMAHGMTMRENMPYDMTVVEADMRETVDAMTANLKRRNGTLTRVAWDTDRSVWFAPGVGLIVRQTDNQGRRKALQKVTDGQLKPIHPITVPSLPSDAFRLA